ncbi:hypothetical protein C2W62_00650 [Candidatus Entotheonella serta]|nr:hypothetical protein C2W62_00650 [Candidatus Entotheonella serta]
MLRELIAGIASGLGLMAMLILGAMPWWIAAILAIGLYVGLRFCLPAATSLDDIVHAGGVTERERQALLRDSRQHLQRIHDLSHQIKTQRPSFAPSVQQLEQLIRAIVSRLEQEPDATRHVGMLPLYLSKMTDNLDRYINLLPRVGHDAQAQKRLSVTEDMVQRATTSFEHLRQQLYRDDWMALEAEAEALKSLLETDLP